MVKGARVFLIAGEPSGDRLGASLIEGLRALDPGVQVIGVGGPLMQAEGLHSLFDMSELSVMGIVEVLGRLPNLLSRVRQSAQAVVREKPDVLVTIDSPDFCLRVARKARAEMPDLRTVHYVAPSVWAWRPDRADKMARTIDHVLALLPFEPPFMEAAGMSCDFVGHPGADDPVPGADQVEGLAAAHGLDRRAPILTVLPGSRRGEVDRLLPIFRDVVDIITPDINGLQVVIPAGDHVADLLPEATANWSLRPTIVDPRGKDPAQAMLDKRAAFAIGDGALAASGTVSIELASCGAPMVIAYDMNWLSRQIIKSKLLTDTVTLVNLVSDTRAVPEFIGDNCRAGLIAPAVRAMLQDGPARNAQLAAGRVTMERLGRGGETPGLRAARSVLAQLG